MDTTTRMDETVSGSNSAAIGQAESGRQSNRSSVSPTSAALSCATQMQTKQNRHGTLAGWHRKGWRIGGGGQEPDGLQDHLDGRGGQVDGVREDGVVMVMMMTMMVSLAARGQQRHQAQTRRDTRHSGG